MFVTADNFKLLPYAIPNLNLVVNTFQQYVDKHEEAILKRLLGITLYDDFITNLEALPDEWVSTAEYEVGQQVTHGVSVWSALEENHEVEPVEGSGTWELLYESQYLKLEKGALFQGYCTCCNHDEVTEWLGIEDMLVPYIWYQWTRDTFDNNSGIGVVQPKAENSEVISPALRLVRAYNEFSAKAHTMQDFIYSEKIVDRESCCFPYEYPGTLNTFNL